MSNPVNISGILVHVRPERAEEVAGFLRAIPGAEVRAVLDSGRIVVVVEEAANRVGDTLAAASAADGVITAALVYQHETADPDEVLEVDSPESPPVSDVHCTKETQP